LRDIPEELTFQLHACKPQTKLVILYLHNTKLLHILLFTLLKQLTREVLQLWCTVRRLGIMTGFAVSVGCEWIVLIWTKWEEELASNFVIFLTKGIANTFERKDNAVTTFMFHYVAVFSNFHKACESQVALLTQRYNCRFTLVTGRHW